MPEIAALPEIVAPRFDSISLLKGRGGRRGAAKAAGGGLLFIMEVHHPGNDAWQCQARSAKRTLRISKVVTSDPLPLMSTFEISIDDQKPKRVRHMALSECLVVTTTLG